jgi:hypothetical protein
MKVDPFSNHQQEELKGQAWAPRWWAVLLIGLALWVASVGVAFFTSDVVLLPTIVLLGSFLIPVTAVVWYLTTIRVLRCRRGGSWPASSSPAS